MKNRTTKEIGHKTKIFLHQENELKVSVIIGTFIFSNTFLGITTSVQTIYYGVKA